MSGSPANSLSWRADEQSDRSSRLSHPDPVADAQELLSLPSGPLLRAFEETTDAWGLDRRRRAALLGIHSRNTYATWMQDPDAVSLDLMRRERIGHVLGIRVALATLFGLGEAANGWPTRPNTDSRFGGRPPIEIMASGTTGALADVRRDLELEIHR